MQSLLLQPVVEPGISPFALSENGNSNRDKKKKECNKKKIKRLRIRIRTDMKYIPIHILQALPRQPEVRCPQEVSYVLQVQPRLQLIDASVFPKPMERGKTHTMLPWDICSQQIQKL